MIQKAQHQINVLNINRPKISSALSLIQLYCQWAEALFYLDSLKIENAIALIEHYIQENGSSQHLQFMLYKLEETQNLDLAYSRLKKLVQTYPQHVFFRTLLGKILHKLRGPNQSDEEHSSLLEEALLHFHQAYNQGHEYETLICLATTYEQLGFLHKDEDYFNKAIETFEKAFNQESADFDSLFLFARALVHYGDVCKLDFPLNRGIKLLLKLLDVDPNNGDLLLLLGYSWIQREMRKPNIDRLEIKVAEKWLLRAYKAEKLESLYFIACLYSLLGQHRKALRYTLKCLEEGVIENYLLLKEDAWLNSFTSSHWYQVGCKLALL